ncbi:MAG: ComEA family DNA-binding protein [Lacisediminihabitans sp.]
MGRSNLAEQPYCANMTSPDQLVPPRRNRLRAGLGAALVLLLLGLGIAVLVTALGPHGVTRSIVAEPSTTATHGAPGLSSTGRSGGGQRSGAMIFVHVLGSVPKPGLFELRDGDRVVDAIAAAGGFADDADQTQVNLARFVADGEQLYVSAVGEVVTTAPGSAGAVGGKVNLNTADLAELETLPRVGPAMAQRIIDWRKKNGRFTAVEDLMSVSGIGDKTFDQLRELVTV